MGFAADQYDLVIAANVLHATSDLRQALRHVRRLLAPDGVLCLLEVTKPDRGVDLTFGTTNGWWRFNDLDLRDYPLLSADRWPVLLEQEHFMGPEVIEGAPMAVLLASAGKTQTGNRSPALTDRELDRERPAIARPSDAATQDRILTAPPHLRREAIEGYLRETLASVTGFAPSAIEICQPVTELGVDSLMALEMKNRVHAVMSVSLPIVRFLEGKNIEQLAAELDAALADNRTQEITDREMLARVDVLSEAEVDAALARFLGDAT